MDFDIYRLDNLEFDRSEEEFNKIEIFHEELIDQFVNSPEGIEYLDKYSCIGNWVWNLIQFGFNYLGTSLPKMNKYDVKEIITDLFPKKISFGNSEEAVTEAAVVVPELLAFWHFLERRFNLPHSREIITFLKEIEPGCVEIMNDSSRFGLAKSFVTLGQQAGFDMSNPEEYSKFTHLYNASRLASETDFLNFEADTPSIHKAKVIKAKKKKIRQMSKASRKKNKKKR